MRPRFRTAPGPFLVAVLSLGALALGAAPRSASAQIVNTLRGFDGSEDGWSGRLEASFARAGGNTDLLSLTAGGKLQWQGERNRWRILSGVTIEEKSDERVEEMRLGHLRHNFRLSPRFATLAFTQIQENPFERLASRFLAGSGLRVDFAQSADVEASFGAAYMLEIEEVSDHPGSDTDHRLSTFLSALGRLGSRTTLDVTIFAQPRFSDWADLRATISAALEIEIVGRLSLLITGNVRHDTEPPDRVEDTDWKTRTGLAWRL